MTVAWLLSYNPAEPLLHATLEAIMSTERLRIGIIYGGRSSEHRVSVNSAKALVESMDKALFEPVPIGIDREGNWHVGADPARMLAAGGEVKALPEHASEPLPAPTGRFLAERFTCTSNGNSRVDVLFPLIHGTFGEDGTLQGLLEMAGLPYVGSGVLGSAVGMDKWTQKLTLKAAGIPVVDFVAFRQVDYIGHEAEIEEQILSAFPMPVFVKPSNSGSSLGIAKVKHPCSLRAAIEDALRYDRRVVVERGMDVRELETALLGNDLLEASRVGEILPQREWYDYEAKYSPGGMRLKVPADITPEQEKEIQTLAIRAFGVMDGSGLARVDFFQDRATGALYLNEINTIPGFTAMSVYSKLWDASGLGYAQLVNRLVALAIERHEAKERALRLI
jgi:D-alanine-D-alanine ligase